MLHRSRSRRQLRRNQRRKPIRAGSTPVRAYAASPASSRSISPASRGSGEKGRITKDDIKAALAGPGTSTSGPATAAGGIPEIPAVDFSKFGEIEEQPLSRIKKISGPHLHRAWLNIPAVTHGDEADITETDRYRKELDTAAKEQGYRVTLLAFLMKAAVSALRKFPEVNSSLNPDKDGLILKKYYHIGIAADTPDGLVVPVIRDVDRKGIDQISRELGDASSRAREGKLSSADLQGASFTISSLGGIGGTHFSPDRQRAGSRDPGRGALEDGAGLGRRAVPAAPDATTLRVL